MRPLVRSSVAIGLVVGAAFGPALFWAIHHDKYSYILEVAAQMGVFLIAGITGYGIASLLIRKKGISILVPLVKTCARKYLLILFNKAVPLSLQKGDPTSVAIFAIDDFGNYVHFAGYLAAEKLIQEIAAVVRGIAGDPSILARSGDDEFIVLLRGVDEEKAFDVVDEARRLAGDIVISYGYGGRVTISAGISTFPRDGTTMKRLIRNAYIALSQAKQKGNMVIQFRDVVKLHKVGSGINEYDESGKLHRKRGG